MVHIFATLFKCTFKFYLHLLENVNSSILFTEPIEVKTPHSFFSFKNYLDVSTFVYEMYVYILKKKVLLGYFYTEAIISMREELD